MSDADNRATSAPVTRSGREMWDLLPEEHRNRDRTEVPQISKPDGSGDEYGHLAGFLDAFGELLDRIRLTLHQRLADAFPDEPPPTPGEAESLAAQSWLLPYFAELLDVRLTSPHVSGRHAEVSNAVAWRKRKGTLRSVEAIAEAVGKMEAEVHEGWRRVVTTPRIGSPLLPATALGMQIAPNMENPLEAARHPGLPVVTPDIRYSSRAIATSPHAPDAHDTRFPRHGEAPEIAHWRQSNRHGNPCFPGSYEDPSRRLVEVSTPDWSSGHYHPERILLYTPPPTGFFPFHSVRLTWAERDTPPHASHIMDSGTGTSPRTVVNPSAGAEDAPASVMLTTNPAVFGEDDVTIEDLNFMGTITVSSGKLTLRRVAARRVVVNTSDDTDSVFDARDCLFDEVIAENGIVRLDACTVRQSVTAKSVLASDCLFAGSVQPSEASFSPDPCFRYSALPETLAALPGSQRPFSTFSRPIFYEFRFCDHNGNPSDDDLEFGDPGYSVLHPATAPAICFGAEDGGEMGAFHHRNFCLQNVATLTKLADFVPIGMEAVLIPDERLLAHPPDQAPKP
ncbi:MAG TPA: phage tail protein [Acidimicrobiia bacterium]